MGDDITLDEKRRYGTKREVSVVAVAAELGVATVEVSGDQIGRFHLEHRCSPRAIAGGNGRLAVATDEDVLVGDAADLEPTGFGPAVAVGVGDGVLAAGPDGEVARLVDDAWTTLGTVPDVRAIDGNLVAAADGVYRVLGDDLTNAGLDDVRDVATAGLPLAATGHGLYYLGNGWMDAHDGAFEVVAAGDDQAHAATSDALYELVGDAHASFDGGQDWQARDLSVAEPVAGVAYGECPYVVTENGTFLVDADPETTPDGGGGWRSRSLGLTGVVGLAVR
ncbi:hypothetical protein VB773_03210 [Haloarculaceae archaeon H-GB2-1]|nr:hypothetical protein [Haloarculaceae archaeon H-GB1-1]MEA5406687.1 hypothetical protein [Haloarculaceae archaeon H-GB2-1]